MASTSHLPAASYTAVGFTTPGGALNNLREPTSSSILDRGSTALTLVDASTVARLAKPVPSALGGIGGASPRGSEARDDVARDDGLRDDGARLDEARDDDTRDSVDRSQEYASDRDGDGTRGGQTRGEETRGEGTRGVETRGDEARDASARGARSRSARWRDAGDCAVPSLAPSRWRCLSLWR